MKISDDEARALAFIAALIVLTAVGRWVDRPRAELPASAEVDLAALTAQTETTVARAAGGRRGPSGSAAPGVARKGSVPLNPWVIPAAPGSEQGARRTGPAGADGPLDLNRATAGELERLPGVGPSLAARIVARRDSAGPFRSFEQLDSVRGIGPALLARLKPLLRLAG